MSLPPNKNILKEFPNQVYVETGIWRGDSIQQAVEAGFEMIIGFDNDMESIKFCKNRFDLFNVNAHHIELYETNTAYGMWGTIQFIDKPMTIYLDAHWQMLEGTERGEDPFPLLDEISQIANHPIKTHTIIVDDLLYLTHPDITGWTRAQIVAQISAINPNYQFSLIANPVINNMLVAWIP